MPHRGPYRGSNLIEAPQKTIKPLVLRLGAFLLGAIIANCQARLLSRYRPVRSIFQCLGLSLLCQGRTIVLGIGLNHGVSFAY